MLGYLQKLLGKVADVETKHFYASIIVILLFTSFCVIGLSKIKFESDLDSMNPQELEAIQLDNKISDKFDSSSAIIILVELDDCIDTGCNINDIRDPEVLEFISRLQTNLEQESQIEEVMSVALLFPYGVPETLDETKQAISQIPQASALFDDAYTFTFVSIQTNIGGNQNQIESLNNRIKDIVDYSSKPGGIKTTVSGEPALIVVMFDMLVNDAITTMLYAAAFIFLLILILQRSFSKSIIIMTPLVFGLSWTLGMMGWLDIPITIATAGLSSMLLGLGVEYSIFLYSRYQEERKNLNVDEAIKKALETTGASTLSSGFTTVIGFAALALSILPALSDLGFVLAMGISFILTSTIVVMPLAIKTRRKLFAEQLKREIDKEKKKESKRLDKAFKTYGNFVANKPIFTIIVAVLITGLMFVGMQKIQNQDIEFDTVLPDGLAELEAFTTIQNEFGETSSVQIYLEVIPYSGTSEYADIRHPDYVNYIDVLTQQAEQMSYIKEVSSLSKLEKEINDNKIPNSLREQKELLENQDILGYVSTDKTASIITITLYKEALDDEKEVVRQVKEIVNNNEAPAGLFVTGAGSMVIDYEVNEAQNPDTMRTSFIAFIGIIILLLILSKSIKYTVLPLMTVVLGIIWTLGFIGFSGVPFSSITSSVITMTIGIGIDFGLQLSFRFRQELEDNKKIKAMQNTLRYTLYPMVITVVAAVIGFSTMRLGNLTLMADLGTTMGFSIVGCMLVAITIVASLILVLERKTL